MIMKMGLVMFMLWWASVECMVCGIPPVCDCMGYGVITCNNVDVRELPVLPLVQRLSVERLVLRGSEIRGITTTRTTYPLLSYLDLFDNDNMVCEDVHVQSNVHVVLPTHCVDVRMTTGSTETSPKRKKTPKPHRRTTRALSTVTLGENITDSFANDSGTQTTTYGISTTTKNDNSFPGAEKSIWWKLGLGVVGGAVFGVGVCVVLRRSVRACKKRQYQRRRQQFVVEIGPADSTVQEGIELVDTGDSQNETTVFERPCTRSTTAHHHQN
jgi:hypothetical protein